MRSKSFHKSSQKKSLSKNNRSKYPSLLPGSSIIHNPMMTSVKMLHTMAYQDESLRAYRQGLIPDQSLINEDVGARVEVRFIKLYHLEKESGKKKLDKEYSYKKGSKLSFVMKEYSTYEIELGILVSENILLGLAIQNSIYKGPIKLKKQSHHQGSFAPSKKEQTTSIRIHTPGGIISRGGYTGQAILRDKFGVEQDSIKYSFTIS